jgi:hypothetical protein
VSLLHRGTETVTVFPEETFTDADGNTRTRPSFVGVVVRAVVQPMTSTEHQTVGFETESKYRLRLVGYPGALGAQSQVDWQRKRYAIDGDPRIYNGPRPEPDWRALWPESAHPLSAARPRMAYAEVKRVSKLADPLKRRGRKAGRAQGHARSSSGSSTCRIPRAPRRANGSLAAPRREVVNSASIVSRARTPSA